MCVHFTRKKQLCNFCQNCYAGCSTLLPISGFVLNKKFQQNTSKFTLFKKLSLAFSIFYIMPLVIVNLKQSGALIRENMVAWNDKSILKCFSGTFYRAQTLKLVGVSSSSSIARTTIVVSYISLPLSLLFTHTLTSLPLLCYAIS